MFGNISLLASLGSNNMRPSMLMNVVMYHLMYSVELSCWTGFKQYKQGSFT